MPLVRVAFVVPIAVGTLAVFGPEVDAAHLRGTPERQKAALPRPLHGVPLGQHTRLRLLVAADPPLLLDVDNGRVTPVRGVDVADTPVLSVMKAAAPSRTAASNDASPQSRSASARVVS
jgi:hypothetical protein